MSIAVTLYKVHTFAEIAKIQARPRSPAPTIVTLRKSPSFLFSSPFDCPLFSPKKKSLYLYKQIGIIINADAQ